MKLIKYGTIFIIGLVILVFVFAFLLYLALKIIFLLLIILGVNTIFKEKEETLRAVANNEKTITLRFKIRNILKFLLSWVMYFSLLSFVLKGVSVNILTESITCLVQLYLSFTYTTNGYKRIVENYFNGRVEMIFPEGLMFFPGVWFFYRVNEPVKIFKGKDGSFTFVDENKNPISDEDGENKIRINLDSTNVLRSRSISGIEDFIYTFFLNNPKFKRSILELDSRRILSSVFLTVLIMAISFSLTGLVGSNHKNFNLNSLTSVFKKVHKEENIVAYTLGNPSQVEVKKNLPTPKGETFKREGSVSQIRSSNNGTQETKSHNVEKVDYKKTEEMITQTKNVEIQIPNNVDTRSLENSLPMSTPRKEWKKVGFILRLSSLNSQKHKDFFSLERLHEYATKVEGDSYYQDRVLIVVQENQKQYIQNFDNIRFSIKEKSGPGIRNFISLKELDTFAKSIGDHDYYNRVNIVVVNE